MDISDENGNVLARFANGHVYTKEFDSSNLPSVDSNSLPTLENQTTDSDADLHLADDNGNSLARFSDGNVRTKYFDSNNRTYHKEFTYNGPGSQSITHFFPSGTELAFHLVMSDQKGWWKISNYKVTYSYIDKNGLEHSIGEDYGYNFVHGTLPEDAIGLSVNYGNGFASGTSYTFSVYSEASFKKKPTIITVSASGGKDYTSLREAVDSIPMNVCELNPYEIHLYPGTYNILEDYSVDEIQEEGFKGLFLENGMSLIGIGRRSEIVIVGELDTTDYDPTKRNDISTLNIEGNVHVENLTIEAYNIRYAVHDEGSVQTHHLTTHSFTNVKFFGRNLTSGGGANFSFGAGCSSYKSVVVKDCDFSDAFLLHTQLDLRHPIFVYMENCSARRFRLTDYDTGGILCHIFMRNCKASIISIGMSGVHDQYLFTHGEGTKGAMVKCPSGYVYETGDTLRFNDIAISAGKAVKIVNEYDSRQNNIVATSSLDDVYGISIGTIDGDTVIQTEGFVNSNVLGLSGLSVGDYLTIDENGNVIGGGTVSNAVAQVKMVDHDSVAYAKLLF